MSDSQKLVDSPYRQEMRVGWFGTSITAHVEAYAAALTNGEALPAVGSIVQVTEVRKRGYVHRLHLELQAECPQFDMRFLNYAQGGITSRELLRMVTAEQVRWERPLDLVFVECGTNDVWLRLQGLHAMAVSPEDYGVNYREALKLLKASAGMVACIGSPPFGWSMAMDVDQANHELAQYRALAAVAAADAGAPFFDPVPAFDRARILLGDAGRPGGAADLWTDGVHLSELGDTLMLQGVRRMIREVEAVEAVSRRGLLDRSQAPGAS